jgi:hypothetical protein
MLRREPRDSMSSGAAEDTTLTYISAPVGDMMRSITEPSRVVTLDTSAEATPTETTVPEASLTVVSTDPSGRVTTVLVASKGDGRAGKPSDLPKRPAPKNGCSAATERLR